MLDVSLKRRIACGACGRTNCVQHDSSFPSSICPTFCVDSVALVLASWPVATAAADSPWSPLTIKTDPYNPPTLQLPPLQLPHSARRRLRCHDSGCGKVWRASAALAREHRGAPCGNGNKCPSNPSPLNRPHRASDQRRSSEPSLVHGPPRRGRSPARAGIQVRADIQVHRHVVPCRTQAATRHKITSSPPESEPSHPLPPWECLPTVGIRTSARIPFVSRRDTYTKRVKRIPPRYERIPVRHR